MGTGGLRDACDVWLWDGATEYEGVVVKYSEGSFTARVRQARPAEGGTRTFGKRMATQALDLPRQFVGRKFLAHFEGASERNLVEAEIDSVQRSSEGEFDYLLAGRFAVLDESQLDVLRKMSIENAASLHQRRVG